MNNTVGHSTPRPQVNLSDLRPTMAKAEVKKTDPDFRAAIGRCIQRAASLLGWTHKELCGHMQRDPAQVHRWITGEDRAQLDALWAVEAMRQPLVVAFAELAQVEVETVIRIRSKR